MEHETTHQTAQTTEFEHQPVTKNSLKGSRKFWGMYAGEHCAGTEFMIGPLFLLNGVSLQNIIFGLLLGNLLAVLSWRFVCAPIAVSARLTLYYHLEKITGKRLVAFYNLANGILFCFLAGAMITVSATAVGIPFNVEMPTFDSLYPNSFLFVIVVLGVGLVISLVASRGYETVANFANLAAPWMILVFLAGGIVALAQLSVYDWDSLQSIWSESLIVAQEGEVHVSMGFWSVVFFAWFCNAAMHFGMSDLSIFRYAKKGNYGWSTIAGMFFGHYIAWIAAALMLAAQIKLYQDPNPVPGIMANRFLGLAGILCVLLAGWTTANPTIYRAGLAFQALFPNSSRMKVTFITGLLATLAGLFPAIAWKLLGFVGIYGTILAPVGGIIFFDWYFIRRSNPQKLWDAIPTKGFHLGAFFAWFIPVVGAMILMNVFQISPWYFPLPCWLICGLLYLFIEKRKGSYEV